jgi:ubiquinone biosynthesis protein COQ9
MTDHTPLRSILLEATLARVPFEGWNLRTLERAAHDAGYDADTIHRAFPQGVEDALTYFSHEMNRRMLEKLAEQDLPAMKIRQRIAAAVRARLEALEPYKEAERRAIAHFAALPTRAALSLSLLYRTVDEMWRAAGDTATDFNFYTKRFLLSKVWTTTLLYWLSDTSDGHADSWAFLDRRIENVMNIQKWKAKATQWFSDWMPNFRTGSGRF